MFRDAFERLLFAARFLLAPLYLALAISLVAILFKSGIHLYDLLMQLPTLNDEQVLLSELGIGSANTGRVYTQRRILD